jgi:hypothetical protein
VITDAIAIRIHKPRALAIPLPTHPLAHPLATAALLAITALASPLQITDTIAIGIHEPGLRGFGLLGSRGLAAEMLANAALRITFIGNENKSQSERSGHSFEYPIAFHDLDSFWLVSFLNFFHAFGKKQ